MSRYFSTLVRAGPYPGLRVNQTLFTIATTMGVITGLVALLVVVSRARADFENRVWGRRRRVLSRRIDAYLRGERLGVGDALGHGISRRDLSLAEEILLRRIHAGDEAELGPLVRAFEELGLVSRYLEKLMRGGWWHRAEAAEGLGLARASRAQPALARALEDEHPEVRFRAARALGQVGDAEVMPALVLALNRPELVSTIRMANVLVSMGPSVIGAIVAVFDELEPRARIAALDVLSVVASVEDCVWIRERLNDADPNIRSRAAKALGAIGDLFAGPALVRALQDPEWPVRAVAAKSLAALRYAPAVPELCDALRDSQWWVRANAAESLRRIGPVGLAALESMLEDSDAYARHQAVFILEEAGVLDDRVEDLFSASNRRRGKSRKFVDRVVESGQCARLMELAEAHPDVQVRAFLAHALERDPVEAGLHP